MIQSRYRCSLPVPPVLPSDWQWTERMAMRARYAAAITFILCATAFPAFAGAYYEMVGGTCTYSNVGDEGGPFCQFGTVTATVVMADGYVPGTSFASFSEFPPSAVAFFSFSDGYLGGETDFPLGFAGGVVSGQMPNGFGLGTLHVHWENSFFFEADGPFWTFCRVSCEGYFSTGNYLEWAGPRVVAEPQSLALAGVALATLVLVRSRRSSVRMRA